MKKEKPIRLFAKGCGISQRCKQWWSWGLLRDDKSEAQWKIYTPAQQSISPEYDSVSPMKPQSAALMAVGSAHDGIFNIKGQQRRRTLVYNSQRRRSVPLKREPHNTTLVVLDVRTLCSDISAVQLKGSAKRCHWPHQEQPDIFWPCLPGSWSCFATWHV